MNSSEQPLLEPKKKADPIKFVVQLGPLLQVQLERHSATELSPRGKGTPAAFMFDERGSGSGNAARFVEIGGHG